MVTVYRWSLFGGYEMSTILTQEEFSKEFEIITINGFSLNSLGIYLCSY